MTDSKRKAVSLDPYITAVLEQRFALINSKRKKINKPPLTYNALVGVAIENLTVQMGVDK